MRRRISRAQQTKNWCVGFPFPAPAYAGIHPTLYIFGFRANALNSHSPLICLALIRGLVSSASRACCLGLSEKRGGGGDLGEGASRGLRGPPLASGGFWRFGGLFVLGLVAGFASFLGSRLPAWTDLKISDFQATSTKKPGQSPERPAPQVQGCWV